MSLQCRKDVRDIHSWSGHKTGLSGLTIYIRPGGRTPCLPHSCEPKHRGDSHWFFPTEKSLPHLMDTIDLFASWSGLKVNTNKTKIVCPRYLREGKTHIRNMLIVDKSKILGIWIGIPNSEHNCYEWKCRKQLERIRAICEYWDHRSLSKGR